MEPRIEVKNFADGRLMVMMRFFSGTNFWINDRGEATWVPTFEEINTLTTLKDTLFAVDNYNEINRRKITGNRIVPQLKP